MPFLIMIIREQYGAATGCTTVSDPQTVAVYARLDDLGILLPCARRKWSLILECYKSGSA
ncbi:MAG: hypothetical protein LBF90_00950 [Prevotellaceae bacterium]|jgi:hypothetical protein|nr:hypothetical protein [Prevotellaceae bacterium]